VPLWASRTPSLSLLSPGTKRRRVIYSTNPVKDSVRSNAIAKERTEEKSQGRWKRGTSSVRHLRGDGPFIIAKSPPIAQEVSPHSSHVASVLGRKKSGTTEARHIERSPSEGRRSLHYSQVPSNCPRSLASFVTRRIGPWFRRGSVVPSNPLIIISQGQNEVDGLIYPSKPAKDSVRSKANA
jgi:hypothetical protein